jgi:hypothetical protein
MIKLKKESLLNSLGSSEIFGNIIQLVKQYPWNNFLQLKVINICNEVITNSNNSEFRKQFFDKSGIAKTFVEMSTQASVLMESERPIRNGYMALVISVSQKLQTKYAGAED